MGDLIADSSGNLYGTSSVGDTTGKCFSATSVDVGCGNVFKLRSDGTGFTILRSFSMADGYDPQSGVILGADGNLYGTTGGGGGSSTYCPSGCGTAFKMKTDGSEFSILHSFLTSTAFDPFGGIALDGNGVLYGTTAFGSGTGGTDGTIFKVKSDGTGFALLHSFSGTDGALVIGSLILDGGGNLYGAAESGGAPGGGLIFTIRTDGTSFRLLHSFPASPTDGSTPQEGVILGADANLYGTTHFGGANNGKTGSDCQQGCGTIFRMKADGTQFSVLRSFSASPTDAANPIAGPIFDGSGTIYGTTFAGGANAACPGGCGTVFKLALPIVVIARSNASPVGAGSPTRVSGRKH